MQILPQFVKHGSRRRNLCEMSIQKPAPKHIIKESKLKPINHSVWRVYFKPNKTPRLQVLFVLTLAGTRLFLFVCFSAKPQSYLKRQTLLSITIIKLFVSFCPSIISSLRFRTYIPDHLGVTVRFLSRQSKTIEGIAWERIKQAWPEWQ